VWEHVPREEKVTITQWDIPPILADHSSQNGPGDTTREINVSKHKQKVTFMEINYLGKSKNVERVIKTSLLRKD
jgi:hypothetical protein